MENTQTLQEILSTAPPLEKLRAAMERLDGLNTPAAFVADTDAQRAYMERVNNPYCPAFPLDETEFFRVVNDEVNGRGFVCRPEQFDVICNLITYFSGNDGEYDTEKGIFLYGGTGSGKTTIMKIMQAARARMKHPVAMTNLPTLYADMLGEGQMNMQAQRDKERIFDDAGAENAEIASFGNRINIFPQLLLLRYQGEYKTHATSNLTPAEIITRPGFDDRVKSRMNEMFNIVHLPGGDFRRGKGAVEQPY